MSVSRHCAAVVWISIIVILMTRIGGAHMHFCFDGDEPPATLHMDDNYIHHSDEEPTNKHTDMDVSLSPDGLVKKITGALDLPALFIACALILFLPRVSILVPRSTPAFVFIASRTQWRPPLRGPPL